LPPHPIPKETKPKWLIDRSLTLGIAAVALIPIIAPPTRPWHACLYLGLIFALSIYPVLHLASLTKVFPSKGIRYVIALFLLAGIITLFGVHIWPPTVTVDPSDLLFAKSAVYTFTLKNNLHQDVYAVALKFSFGVHPNKIKLDSPLGQARVLASDASGLGLTDMTGMTCRTKQGSYNLYAEGESREFSLMNISDGAVEIQSRISHYEVKPKARIIDDKKGLLNPVMADEDCDLISILGLMK
jgi:hypothetical protein